jgi:hypothetical protein
MDDEGLGKRDVLHNLLEEYRTLREESLTGMKNQQSVFNITLLAIGLLATAAANFWDKEMVIPILLGLFGPVAAGCLANAWLGEVGRMMRAGGHLKDLENRINDLLGQTVLTWENRIRAKTKDRYIRQMLVGYFATLSLFYGSGLAALAITIIWVSQVLAARNQTIFAGWIYCDPYSFTFFAVGTVGYLVTLCIGYFNGRKLKDF